jgi:hypothetical protein
MRDPPMLRLTRASDGNPFFRLLVTSKAKEVLVLVLFHDDLHWISRRVTAGGLYVNID